MSLPSSYKALVIKELTPVFRTAVTEKTLPLAKPGPEEIIVKNRYASINATDVNVSAGRYSHRVGSTVGLEGLGEVVQVGSNVKNFKVGDYATFFAFTGTFSEYTTVEASLAFPVPELKPEYLSLLISGLTASIGLDKAGEIKKGDKVLITAAAGALGQIAVQWCKSAGCHVIGLTSTDEKAIILKDLGCDEIINYKTQDVDKVLSEKYPKGIDVIWETIGGELFDILFKHLAEKGRLVIIGFISKYISDKGGDESIKRNIPSQLLWKSATIRGFILTHYMQHGPKYFKELFESYSKGTLTLQMEDGSKTEGGQFKGLEGCIRGVEYLHSGKSTGKIFVAIQQKI